MIKIFCEKCGNTLEDSRMLTVVDYDAELDVLMSEAGELIIDSSADYLLFICNNCGFQKKISFSMFMEMIKKDLLTIVANNRLSAAIPGIDKSKVKEENGISFCGMCLGVIDGSGYCYNDVISQCSIRKFKTNAK